MYFRIPLFVAVSSVILQVIAAGSVESLFAAKEESSETERIVDGKPAEVGQFPWVAALFFRGRFICTSSIISPRTIVTAAHCVVFDGAEPSDFRATANTLMNADGQQVQFSAIDPHPDYDPLNIVNDIAIMTTSQDIVFDDTVRPICIAGSDTRRKAYKNATAMGWGNTSRNRTSPVIPNNLMYVEQHIIPNLLCRLPYFGLQIQSSKICAGGLFNGICNGDSGGPLVHLSRDNPPVAIGVASYINAIFGCGSLAPGVWTRISSFQDFILAFAADPENICIFVR